MKDYMPHKLLLAVGFATALWVTPANAERDRVDEYWPLGAVQSPPSELSAPTEAQNRSDLSDDFGSEGEANIQEENLIPSTSSAPLRKRNRSLAPIELGEERPELPPVDEAEIQVIEEPEPPLIYQPEKLEALKADLTEGPPSGAIAAAIHAELKGRGQAVRVTSDEKRALVEFYRLNGFRPLWVSNEGLGERGRAVLRTLAASAEEGLFAEDYLPPSLASFDDDASLLKNDASRLGRLDLELSTYALRYTRHASGGRVIPNKLTIYHDITLETVELSAVMKAFQRSPSPASYLRSLQPEHPAYQVFKTALAQLRKLRSASGGGLILTGKRVKPGASDARITLLRRHLDVLGYIKADVSPIDERVLDESVSERLATFQKDVGIKSTGALDAATVKALNTRNGQQAIARLIYNMERLRWLPKALGDRHVFVNQAAFTLQLVEKGREIWRTNVIVGKPTSQTVAFSDRMETVVFNPPWGVPPSIMKNEMLPRLRRDPGYLDRMGYRVLTPDGKVIRSRSVRWAMYEDEVPFLIQQPPSEDNAMGEVKFLFPNAHSIYFHDTPNRSLFKRANRALSHGCVRVENPRRFAELLLSLDASDIAALIDDGSTSDQRISRETKVHLTYFTAWPAADRRILYYEDIYGRDERMERAFSSLTVASR